jgi:OOP family OmpA-OmpF porin
MNKPKSMRDLTHDSGNDRKCKANKEENMDRKNIFRALLSVVVLVLFMGCATQQQARPAIKAVDLNPKITSGQFVQKVDTFMVIFDASSSMNDLYKNDTKMNQQKGLVALLDNTVPNLKLTGGLRIFGQLTFFGDPSSKTIYWSTDYRNPDLTKAVASFWSGNGFSPLDAALDGAAADLRTQSGRMAVIAFSDGEDMEQYKPVAAAKRMKDAYGDRICIYTVHLGANAAGRKLMQQVADEGRCGAMVTGDSIASTEGMANFVERIFLEDKRDKQAKQPAPLPGPSQQEKVVEQEIIEKGRATLLVEFDFDRAVVKPEYHKEIEKLTNVMKKYPDLNFIVEGHTCNIGTKEYNDRLSRRRAGAIKEVMVKKFGIDAARIKTIGYGLSRPTASNATREGRQQNRRVEAAVEYKKN